MLARHARQCHIDGTAAGRSRGKTMMMLPISLTIAAGAALLNIWLAMRVSRTRRQEEVWVGDGGNERVIRRMRAHSNFIENTALVLILLVQIGRASCRERVCQYV